MYDKFRCFWKKQIVVNRIYVESCQADETYVYAGPAKQGCKGQRRSVEPSQSFFQVPLFPRSHIPTVRCTIHTDTEEKTHSYIIRDTGVWSHAMSMMGYDTFDKKCRSGVRCSHFTSTGTVGRMSIYACRCAVSVDVQYGYRRRCVQKKYCCFPILTSSSVITEDKDTIDLARHMTKKNTLQLRRNWKDKTLSEARGGPKLAVILYQKYVHQRRDCTKKPFPKPPTQFL